MLLKEELAVANAAASMAGAHGIGPNALNPGAGGAIPSTSTNVEALATTGLKSTEIISILKRRNNSSENVTENLKYTAAPAEDTSLSLHSQTYSDNSVQKYGDKHDRDDDDEDDDSDSDWDGFQDSQRSSSGFDMSDLASSFFREISDVLLSK